MDNSTSQTDSPLQQVKKSKDYSLKERLKTLIKRKGLSEADFYNTLRISRQYWYAISWGIWETPLDLKVKIALTLETDTGIIWQNMKEVKNGESEHHKEYGEAA